MPTTNAAGGWKMAPASAAKNNRVFVLRATDVLPLSSLITGYIQKIADATCGIKN